MHLWPSLKLRDSFKGAYLKKLEWNLHRMDSGKEIRSNQQKLLNEGGKEQAKEQLSEASGSKNPSGFSVICSELLMIISCCYCCFCCGACIDQEEV